MYSSLLYIPPVLWNLMSPVSATSHPACCPVAGAVQELYTFCIHSDERKPLPGQSPPPSQSALCAGAPQFPSLCSSKSGAAAVSPGLQTVSPGSAEVPG